MTAKNTIEIPATVPMPSADLINFRFDQNDANVAEVKRMIAELSAGFVTEKEMTEAKIEGKNEHERLQQQIDDIKKNAKWWLTFIFVAMSGVAALILALKK